MSSKSLWGKATDALGLGWVKWLLFGLAAAAIVAAAWSYNESLRAEGRAEEANKALAAKVIELDTAKKALEQQIAKTKEYQDAYLATTQTIQSAERRAFDAQIAAASIGSRVQQLAAASKQSIPGASADRVRQYAAGAVDLFEDCRRHYERVTGQAQNLGIQAAGAAAAAHTLKASNDLLSRRPIPPIAPVPPTPPN